jgi:hypothetical protein
VLVNMAECNVSADETVCSDRVCDYRKHASHQHSSVNGSCLWRKVCRHNQQQKNSILQCVLAKSCLQFPGMLKVCIQNLCVLAQPLTLVLCDAD